MGSVQKLLLAFFLFVFCNLPDLQNVTGHFTGHHSRIKGYEHFNWKPRKTQVSNISPQALGHIHHPQGARIIRSSNFEIEYEIGRKIVLICQAKGEPLPNLSWLKDGVELFHHKWALITEWVYQDYRQIKSSKLEIHPATTMDKGLYECLAENKYSIDRRRFRTEYLD